jgi:hypothetical protein
MRCISIGRSCKAFVPRFESKRGMLINFMQDEAEQSLRTQENISREFTLVDGGHLAILSMRMHSHRQ